MAGKTLNFDLELVEIKASKSDKSDTNSPINV
jgi:FKBP-type peptidyl-prolyl cis-trans isomerase 2